MVQTIPIESESVGVILTNRSGLVLGCNSMIEKLTGFCPAELKGKPLSLFGGTAAGIEPQKLLDILQERDDWNGRLICNTKSGKSIQVQMFVTVIQGDSAEQDRLAWSMRDLRNLKDIENQLIQAQKMEAIGTLTGGIAHDFNNVLNIVSGFTSLALRNVTDTYSRRCLFNVLEASDRASDLVKQILSFTQREAQAYMPVSLRPLLKGILKLLRSALPENIQIGLSMEEGPFQVLGNPTQIHQVFLNLATNASHAMRQGGQMKVSVKRVHLSSNTEIWPDLLAGHFIHITFSDSGHGMDETVARRVFEPFFTTKGQEEGTGLGLSVVSEIIKNHSGQIQVESTVGEGTTFTIMLPELKVEESESREELSYHAPETATILLVDDEKILLEVISEGLTASGFKVQAFSDSQEAFAAFAEDPNAYSVILSDLMMPGFSGIEFATRVFQVRKDMSFVLCTGYLDPRDEKLALQLGIRRVVRKPVMIQQLVRELTEVIWDSSNDGSS